MQIATGLKLLETLNILFGVVSFVCFLLVIFGVIRLETRTQRISVALGSLLLFLVILLATSRPTPLQHDTIFLVTICDICVIIIMWILSRFGSHRPYRIEPRVAPRQEQSGRLPESEVNAADLPELLRIARKDHPSHPRIEDLGNIFHRWQAASSKTCHVFEFVVIEDRRISALLRLVIARFLVWVRCQLHRFSGRGIAPAVPPRRYYRRIGFTCVIPLRREDYLEYAGGRLSEWDIGTPRHPIPQAGSPYLLIQAIELLPGFRRKRSADQALLRTLANHLRASRGSTTEPPHLIANGNTTGESILKKRGFACIVQADEESNLDGLPIYELDTAAATHTNRAMRTIEFLGLDSQ